MTDTPFKTTATITGTCQSGLTVTASGAGITGTPSDTCLASAFSINVTLDGADGSKAITLTSADTVGNTSTVNFTLIKDNLTPTLTQTTITDNPRLTNTSSVTFGGACETGISVMVTGSETATRSCTAGAWTFATNKTSDATYTYNFSQTDVATNSTSITGYQWTRDTNPPALTWTSPVDGFAAQTQFTATGTCETGLNVTFGGAGLVGTFSQMCVGGAYSQVLYFSANEGSKTVSISQTDLATNTTTVTKTLSRDETPPAITQTLRSSPYYTNTNAPTFGGACESGRPITVIRNTSTTETTSLTCTGSTWTYTTADQTTDGPYIYSIAQTDAAGNSSSTSATWIRDVVDPVIAFTSSSNLLTANNTEVFQGICETGSSNNAALVVREKNSGGSITHTGASICQANGTFSYTAQTQTTDGVRTYEITQTDKAGNDSTIIATWERNSTIPNLTIAESSPLYDQNSSVTLTGTCETGTPIEITVNAVVTEANYPCTGSTYSYTYNNSNDAVYNVTLTQDGPVLSITRSITWVRDTVIPTLTASEFEINGGLGTTKRSRVSASMRASDTMTSITHFCLITTKQTDASPSDPAASNDCWKTVESAGAAASQNLILTGYGYNLPLVPDDYRVYGWVMDRAGNISALTNSGNGTASRDFDDIDYVLPQAPVVNQVLATKRDNPSLPQTADDLTTPAGSAVFIKWQITDDSLSAGAVKLEFTTDDLTYSSIATGLSDASTNGTACTINNGATAADDTMTGCYRWSAAPTSGYFKIRVVVTDDDDLIAGATSAPLNVADKINFIAGNTDEGTNMSASSALFIGPSTKIVNLTQGKGLAVTRDGIVFMVNEDHGLTKIDPVNGLKKIYIKKASTSTGDGGQASSATVRFVSRIALDFETPQNLWISDYNRIRKVNTATDVIETVIGGGSDASDNVANPLDAALTYFAASDVDQIFNGAFFMGLDGNFYFQFAEDVANGGSLTSRGRTRYLDQQTGQIKSFKVQTLTSITTGSTDAVSNFMGCNPRSGSGFLFENNALEKAVIPFRASATNANCNQVGTGRRWGLVDAQGNSLTGGPHGVAGVTSDRGAKEYVLHQGLDGNLYMSHKGTQYGIWRYNSSSSPHEWVQIYGNGTYGTCPDDSDANSCASAVDSVFVNESGDIYFTEFGMIRFIDKSNKAKTLFGQPLVSSEGTSIASARLGNGLRNLAVRDDGAIIFPEPITLGFYEFQRGGNLHHILGNGNLGLPTAGATGESAHAFETASARGLAFALDSLTGDLYFGRGNFSFGGSHNRINKFTRNSPVIGSDGIISSWIGSTGSYNPANPSADYSSDISFGSDCAWNFTPIANHTAPCRIAPLVWGTVNGKLFAVYRNTNRYTSPSTGTTSDFYRNPMTKLYGISDKVQHPLVFSDQGDVHASGTTTNPITTCTDGTPLSACSLFSGAENITQPAYSADHDTYFAAIDGSTKINKLKPGDNLATISTLQPVRSLAFRKNGAAYSIYYCSDTTQSLRKITLSSDLDLISDAAFEWPISGVACNFGSLHWNESTSSLIFSFTQNGQSGIAEYFDP